MEASAAGAPAGQGRAGRRLRAAAELPMHQRLWQWAMAYPGVAFLLLSVLVVLVAYGRALTGPFVYDDLDQIVNNPNLGSWAAFVARFLERPVALTNDLLGHGGATYRPVFWLSLFFDHRIWGLRAAGYHLTNLIVHLINGNLAFLLLRRLRMPVLLAGSVCLLWLLLPINAEVVGWVSGRAYALCLLFILLSLILGLRVLQKGGLTIAAGCFFTALLALLSHESGVLVAPLFLLVAFGAGELRSSRSVWGTLGAMLAAVAGWWGLERALHVASATHLGSVWAVGEFFWKYVGLIALPVRMSVERSTTTPGGGISGTAIVALAGVVALVAACVWLRRRAPLVSAGAAWMALCLLPFCGALAIYQGMAERFAYIASLGFALAVVGACALVERQSWRVAGLSVAACWVAWSGWRVVVRAGDWSDPVRLYRSSLEATPRSPALAYNLGFSLRNKGDLAGALTGYQRALELQPGYPHAEASLGDVYLQQGRFAQAQGAYQRSLAADPKDVKVLLNSGVAYERAGLTAEAERTFQAAIPLAPHDAGPWVDLGTLYLQEKRWNDAASEFVHGIDANSQDPTPYYDLAVLLQRAGKNDLALSLYKKVLELRPNDADAMENMRRLQGGN
ncbi:MAG TPA: tetratricopeptide repeat protein [Granulicella sp.]|nr:tetratricopeptide repeat protein [Granulicella sp.]